MQLSKFSDYAFRALIYMGNNKDKLCTVEELALQVNTSGNHMKKVVHRLSNLGFISSLKGRGGGLKLGRQPEEINLGEVLVAMEENMNLYACYSSEECPLITEGCILKKISKDALRLFVEEYQRYTLKDLLRN